MFLVVFSMNVGYVGFFGSLIGTAFSELIFIVIVGYPIAYFFSKHKKDMPNVWNRAVLYTGVVYLIMLLVLIIYFL